MSKRLLASILGFFVLAALGLLPKVAAAQTTTTASITINTGTQATELVDANHVAVTHAFVSDQPFWVNLAECKLGWQYQISVTTLGIGSSTMEVWAGGTSSDCTQALNRFSNNVCWRVGIFGITDGTSAIYIPVQNVVGQHFLNQSDSGSTAVPVGTAADCDTIARGNTPEAGVAINLNFYIFGGGSTGVPTYSATWGNAGYDLIGPASPGTLSVQPADTELYVSWQQVVVTDLSGYHIYCKVPEFNFDAGALSVGGAASTGGAGAVGGTASTGGAGAVGGASALGDAGLLYNQSCPDNQLQSGNLPNATMTLSGTAADKLATSGIASGLTNGVNYACAISAYDTRQNDGPLSVVQCGTPWWVNDFFSTYRSKGGKAGGGFCSIGVPRSSIALIIPLASIVLLALRRRRSKP